MGILCLAHTVPETKCFLLPSACPRHSGVHTGASRRQKARLCHVREAEAFWVSASSVYSRGQLCPRLPAAGIVPRSHLKSFCDLLSEGCFQGKAGSDASSSSSSSAPVEIFVPYSLGRDVREPKIHWSLSLILLLAVPYFGSCTLSCNVLWVVYAL